MGKNADKYPTMEDMKRNPSNPQRSSTRHKVYQTRSVEVAETTPSPYSAEDYPAVQLPANPTVADLIEALQAMPADTPVCTEVDDACVTMFCSAVSFHEEEKVYTGANEFGYVGPIVKVR